MKGFIIYPTYRIINSQPYIFLFGRLENGQTFLTINSYEPYFYVKLTDIKKLPKEYHYEKTNLKNFNNEPVIKILAESPKDIPILRHEIEENNIETYEADIRFSQRYLIDKDIKSTLNIEGDYQQGEFVDRIYNEPELTPCDNYQPQLKLFSLDIETSVDAKKLYSIAIYSDSYQKVLLVSNKKIENALTFKDEASLLEEFKKIIYDEDPDIITGWNLIDFDLVYLQKKFKKHEIAFTLGRINQSCKIKISKDFFRDSNANFPGRIVLDALSILRSSFIKLDNYKLNTAAKTILNDTKLLSEEEKSGIDSLYKENPKKLISYNLKDAELVYKILEKTKTLDLIIQKSLLTGLQLDRTSASIASLDSLYLRELKKINYVAPTSKFRTKEKPITGGYVMTSIPGIYDFILILDFKSLYPSLIRTFNIDPFSYLGKTKEKNAIKSPNNVYFKNEKGILSKILEDLWKARDEIKKRNDKIASFALKTLMASFFGVLANPSCRFFNTNIANAITHFGQFFIKLTVKKIQEQGYEVIYADTDSTFIVSKAENLQEAEKIGNNLQKTINSFLEKYIQENYKRKSFLELEFEKTFIRFLMPKLRESEIGAKKRYAGLTKEGKIEFTGLESKRSDWTELAKNFQYELLNRIFHKKEVSNFIKNFVSDIRKGKHDNKLIYRKSIRKNLADYQVKSQHLKAALKLEKLDSNIIEYIMTEDGPEPIQNIKHKIDYEHYIQKQIKPIADSILVFYNKTFDELLQGTKQFSLFDFK